MKLAKITEKDVKYAITSLRVADCFGPPCVLVEWQHVSDVCPLRSVSYAPSVMLLSRQLLWLDFRGRRQRRWFYLATKSVVLGRTVLRLIVLLECGGAMEFVVKTELRPSQAHTQTHVRLSPSQTGHRETECCNRWVFCTHYIWVFGRVRERKKCATAQKYSVIIILLCIFTKT